MGNGDARRHVPAPPPVGGNAAGAAYCHHYLVTENCCPAILVIDTWAARVRCCRYGISCGCVRKETFQGLARTAVRRQCPSRHALTPSRPHALTPSRPHALTPCVTSETSEPPHNRTNRTAPVPCSKETFQGLARTAVTQAVSLTHGPHCRPTPSRSLTPSALTPSRLGRPNLRTNLRTTAQTVAPVPAPGTLFAPPAAGTAGPSDPLLPDCPRGVLTPVPTHARRSAFAHVEGGAPGTPDEFDQCSAARARAACGRRARQHLPSSLFRLPATAQAHRGSGRGAGSEANTLGKRLARTRRVTS